MKLDTIQTAETPEGLALVLRPAGIAPRALAYLIDWLARVAIYTVAAIGLSMLKGFGAGVLLVVYFGLEWLYPVVFELLPGGATPGKRSMGLQVLMDDGLPVTVSASVVRNLLRTADFLPAAFGFGLLSMLLRRDFKRLGDLAAGTLVVHKDLVRRHGALPPAEPQAPRHPLTRPQQMAVVRLAGRSARLTAARLDELAAHAEPVLPRARRDESPGQRLLSLAQWLQGATMTPHQFEHDYAPLWQELARGLDRLDRGGKARPAKTRRKGAFGEPDVTAPTDAPVGAARVADLYRQACEHLALARERAYPIHLVEQLEALTTRAHQRIYRRSDFGLSSLRQLVVEGIPAAVRALRGPLLLTALLFTVTLVGSGLATWHDPHFILTIADAKSVGEYDKMYGPASEHLGRTAGTDWMMFGYYVMHNIGLAFQCFAAGITLGVGSLVVIAYNGIQIGGIAGYLVSRGDALRFFSFVVTHSAFELTAIVMAGACGLRLGQAVLMPGRLTRVQALRAAATATAPVVYAMFGMLVIAAALEAFWSSAGWIAPIVKFGAGASCWLLVLSYLSLPGRVALRERRR